VASAIGAISAAIAANITTAKRPQWRIATVDRANINRFTISIPLTNLTHSRLVRKQACSQLKLAQNGQRAPQGSVAATGGHFGGKGHGLSGYAASVSFHPQQDEIPDASLAPPIEAVHAGAARISASVRGSENPV
jgi:hypothetical protein